MNKREIKQWALEMAADILRAEVGNGFIPDETEPERDKKKDALMEIADELRRRSGAGPYGESTP